MSDIVESLLQHIGRDELDDDDQIALVPRWEVKEAAAEIERLRGLLRDIADAECLSNYGDQLRQTDDWQRRAREALGE